MVWLPPPTGHTNMPNIALLTSAHSLEDFTLRDHLAPQLCFIFQDHVIPTWLTLVFFECPNSPSLHRLILILYFTWPAPTCLRFTIKTSRSDPFPKCCQIFIGQGNPPLCALSASEFTVSSSSYSNPVLHLTVADISAPACLHHHQDFQVWLISTKAAKCTLAEVSPTLCLTWNCMEVLLVHFFYVPMVCLFLLLSFLNGQKIVL